MASSSPETNPEKYFGFSDLRGFKDFVVYVLSCAPDLFPVDDWVEPDEQMNLERAFAGLRYGLSIVARERGLLPAIAECRRLVDASFADYEGGRDSEGQKKLEEVVVLLRRLSLRG